MDKIKEAQTLADQLLDECNTVGDNKGALKDVPESIKKSEEDLEDYVSMESDEVLDERYLEKDEVNKLHKMRTNLANKHQKQSKHPTIQKYNTFSKTNKMKRTADKKKRDADFNRIVGKANRGIKENETNQISTMVSNIATFLGEEKEVKVSDVPKDKQKIFKINRGKAREKGGKLTKAEKGGKPIKEADQVATAQQKDTLFDKLERVTKNSDKLKATITQEPTTEAAPVTGVALAKMRRGIERNDRNLKLGNSMDPKAKANAKKRLDDVKEGDTLKKLQSWGKKFMDKKRKQGLKITQKKDKALKDTMKG